MRTPAVGLPPGLRDRLGTEARRRRTAENALAELFEQEGYAEVIPSGIEFLELYARGHQHVLENALRFLDRNDRLLALRADFTPSVARIVAGSGTAASGVAAGGLAGSLPVRLWYAGSVFRKAEAAHGGYAELAQVGVELIGLGGSASDAEVIDLAMRALERLGLRDVLLHLNHAGLFRGLVAELNLDRGALAQVTAEIDRKDVRGLARRLEVLGVAPGLRSELRTIATCVGGPEVLDAAASALRNVGSLGAVEELRRLASSLARWSDRIVYDLAEIDELEYYSGVMFSFFTRGVTAELGRGGRYDAMLSAFGLDLPAVGFSFSTDRLVELL